MFSVECYVALVERPSTLTRYALLRRRVHKSWVTTLIVAVVGGGIFLAAGLMPVMGVLGVIVALALLRPIMEVYFSSVVKCPHCEADLFLEMCAKETLDGVEEGFVCKYCGKNATSIDSQNGPVVDID